MKQPADDSVLDLAGEAIHREAWDEAYRLLSDADHSRTLDQDALPTLADTAYLAGHPEEAIDAWERVHAAAVRAGEDELGAGAAGQVATLLLYTGLLAPARGWIRRAESLLVDHPDSPVHGQLAVVHAWTAVLAGDLHHALLHARRAVDVGTRLGRSGHPGPWAERRGSDPHPPGAPPGGTCRPGGDGRGSAVRGAGSRHHRNPVLQHGVRVPGAGRVRPSRGMDRRHGPMVPSARDRGLSRACAGSTVRRSSGSAGTGTTPRSRLGRRRRSSAGTRGPMWAGLRRSSGRSDCGWGTSRAPRRPSWRRTSRVGPESRSGPPPAGPGDAAAAAGSIRDSLENQPQIASIEAPPNTDLRRAPLLAAEVLIAVAAGDLGAAREAAEDLNRIATSFGTKALRASAAASMGSCSSRRGGRGGREALPGGDAPVDRGGRSVRVRHARMGLGEAFRAQGTSGRRSSSSTRPTRRSSGSARDSMSAVRRRPPGTPSRPRGRGWRRCSCSPTSSSPRTWSRSSETKRGGISSGGTTTCSPHWLRATEVRSYGPRATGSSSRSTALSPRSPARWPFKGARGASP